MRANEIDLQDYRNIPEGMTTKTYLYLRGAAPNVLRDYIAGRCRNGGFRARWTGACPLCGESFVAGTWVQYGRSGVLAHPLCHRAAAWLERQRVEALRRRDARHALRRRAKGRQ